MYPLHHVFVKKPASPAQAGNSLATAMLKPEISFRLPHIASKIPITPNTGLNTYFKTLLSGKIVYPLGL